MGRIFNYDGPFLSTMSRMADLFWLNILFVVCCIPIFTIGAASTALYYVTLKMVKDEESYITKAFFKSFKDNFKQATAIWLIFVVIITIMISDLFIINGGTFVNITMNGNISKVVLVAVGIIAIVVSFVMTYVFAILAQFDNTVKNTIKNSFLISVRHLPYTVLMIVITLIPLVLIYFDFRFLLLVVIMFSLVAYINSKFFKKIFVLYMPKEENEENDDEKIFHDEALIKTSED